MVHSRQPSINSQSFRVSTPELVNPDDSVDDTTSSSSSIDEEVHDDFDPAEYLSNSLNSVLSSLAFEKSVVIQAKTSGVLKAKELELNQLIEEAEAKLTYYEDRFKKSVVLINQIRKTLLSSEKKIENLRTHVSKTYPIEYSQAKDKILSRTLDEDENYI